MEQDSLSCYYRVWSLMGDFISAGLVNSRILGGASYVDFLFANDEGASIQTESLWEDSRRILLRPSKFFSVLTPSYEASSVVVGVFSFSGAFAGGAVASVSDASRTDHLTLY
ncbi:hypothetical protein BDZ89DRAFT_172569 [Hymenopellis radicata]|nr:hypothetical protein BDZ89DRAFT_172569 [Hymenopellis radicata]